MRAHAQYGKWFTNHETTDAEFIADCIFVNAHAHAERKYIRSGSRDYMYVMSALQCCTVVYRECTLCCTVVYRESHSISGLLKRKLLYGILCGIIISVVAVMSAYYGGTFVG